MGSINAISTPEEVEAAKKDWNSTPPVLL